MIPGYIRFSKYPNNEVEVKACRPHSSRQTMDTEKDKKEIVLHPDPLPPEASPPSRHCSDTFTEEKLAKGSKGIPRDGLKKIRRMSGLFMDEEKEFQVFLTGTLPGSTRSAKNAFAQHSAYVVKMVQTYLSRTVQCDAGELKYLWVWELQKRGALHMHLLVQLPRREQIDTLLSGWGSLWERVLRLVDEKCPVDIFQRQKGGSWRDFPEVWQTDAQAVKKSAARYLSKYLSKGSQGNVDLCPSRWWGCSSLLRLEFREYCKENIISLPFSITKQTKRNDFRDKLREVLGDACGGYGTDLTQYFQDVFFGAFSYIPGGGDVLDVAQSVIQGLGEMLEKSESLYHSIVKGFGMKSRINACMKVLSIMPLWASLSVKKTLQGLYPGKTMREILSVTGGYDDFYCVVQYTCMDYRGLGDNGPLWGFKVMDVLNNL